MARWVLLYSCWVEKKLFPRWNYITVYGRAPLESFLSKIVLLSIPACSENLTKCFLARWFEEHFLSFIFTISNRNSFRELVKIAWNFLKIFCLLYIILNLDILSIWTFAKYVPFLLFYWLKEEEQHIGLDKVYTFWQNANVKKDHLTVRICKVVLKWFYNLLKNMCSLRNVQKVLILL